MLPPPAKRHHCILFCLTLSPNALHPGLHCPRGPWPAPCHRGAGLSHALGTLACPMSLGCRPAPCCGDTGLPHPWDPGLPSAGRDGGAGCSPHLPSPQQGAQREVENVMLIMYVMYIKMYNCHGSAGIPDRPWPGTGRRKHSSSPSGAEVAPALRREARGEGDGCGARPCSSGAMQWAAGLGHQPSSHISPGHSPAARPATSLPERTGARCLPPPSVRPPGLRKSGRFI